MNEVTQATVDMLVVIGAVAGIPASIFVTLDISIKRWGYIKTGCIWMRNQATKLRPKTGSDLVTLELPPVLPIETSPIETSDGVTRTIAKYIMYGQERLLAYTTTRLGFPGTRYLVERHRPDRPPQSLQSPRPDEANASGMSGTGSGN